jgi:hypothetical protein
MNEERLEHAHSFCFLSLSLSLSLSMTGEEGVHTLFTGREREREKEGGRIVQNYFYF